LNLSWVAIVLAPVFWMVATSILPIVDLMNVPPALDLSHASLTKYQDELLAPAFQQAFINSMVIATFTAIVSVMGGALGAYAIARYTFRGKQSLLLLLLGTQMAPGIIMVIPSYMLLNAMHLIDTYTGLIMIHVAFLSPLVIWLLYGFFQDIPPSLERAARIDGCTRLQALRLVIAPLSVNGLAAATIFCFISTWASFLFPLVLTLKRVTLPILISGFAQIYELDFSEGARYGVLVALPVVIIALVAQRYIIRGLVEGAVKQ
jgi:multiple sugar transport system permease protein